MNVISVLGVKGRLYILGYVVSLTERQFGVHNQMSIHNDSRSNLTGFQFVKANNS